MDGVSLLVHVLIAGLAAWRVAYALTAEDGPFDAFIALRGALGAFDLDADGRPATWLGRGAECIYCVSFWVGLAFGALAATGRAAWLVPLAVAAVALWAHRLIRRV